MRCNILHIDDDIDFLDVFSRIFSKEFRISTANEYEQAVNLFREQEFDAVILDYEMPRANGLELLHQIKEEYPDLPVILYTGQGSEEIAREAFVAGASDYFIKNFCSFAHKELLTNSIRNAIEKSKTEKALKEKEEMFRRLYEEAPIGYQSLDSDGRFLDVNNVWLEILGYTKDEIIGRPFTDILTPYYAEQFIDSFPEFKRKGRLKNVEFELRRKDNSTLHVSFDSKISYGETGEFIQTHCVFYDITDRKQAEREKTMSIAILDRLNRPGTPPEIIGEILNIFRESTEFDAIGIRLKNGKDYPFYISQGFSDSFLLKENFLCTPDQNAQTSCTAQENIQLACICGKVINGDIDVSLPYFTPGGSFWSNNLSSLVPSLKQARGFTDLRGQCLVEGYESMALIPLRSTEGTIGILQLASSKPDRFYPGMISFLEGMGASIGVAMARKRDEDALLESKNLIRLMQFVIDRLTVPFFLVATDGSISMVNSASCRFLGYSQEELLSKKMADLDDKFTSSYMADKFKHLQYNKVYNICTTISTRDGSKVPVEVLSSYLEFMGSAYCLSFVYDVSERVKNEKLQKEMKDTLETIIDIAPLPVFALDLEGRVSLAWNSAAEEMLGWRKEEVIGKPLPVTPVENSEGARELCLLCLQGITLTGREVSWQKRDGTPFDCSLYTALLRDYQDNATGCIVMLVDITERMAMERQLINKNKELLDFSYMVSHDLKKPISLITGYAVEALESRMGDSTIYDKIIARCQNMQSYIDKLLFLSQAGKIIGFTEQVNIEELMQNAFVSHKPESIEAVIEVENPLPRVEGDKESLERLFTNIIANALENPNPAQATLKIRVSHRLEDTYDVISIQDNGSGILHENQDKLFIPGFTIRGNKGTGFGLVIARKIIEGHGGTISLRSDGRNQGTEVILKFPRARQRELLIS